MAALNAGGSTENAETGRFAEKPTHGREVFALFRNNALCVTSIVVGMVDGAEPRPEAKKDGKVRLIALKHYQREWWVSIDSFGVPETPKPPPMPPGHGRNRRTEKIGEPEKDAPMMEPAPKY